MRPALPGCSRCSGTHVLRPPRARGGPGVSAPWPRARRAAWRPPPPGWRPRRARGARTGRGRRDGAAASSRDARRQRLRFPRSRRSERARDPSRHRGWASEVPSKGVLSPPLRFPPVNAGVQPVSGARARVSWRAEFCTDGVSATPSRCGFSQPQRSGTDLVDGLIRELS